LGRVVCLDPGRGLSLIWLQPFPSDSPTHHNALTPPRTPPSNLPHGTGYRTARGTARHRVCARPVTRDRVGGALQVVRGASRVVRAHALDTWFGAWCVVGGARPCTRHVRGGARPCTRHLVRGASRVVRARALDTWCAPVHSTPGARPCTRHLVRARALDTWCTPVHSTPGARPCTRHLVRARALDTWCAPVHSTPPLPTGSVVIRARSHDSVTHCTLDIQAFLKKTKSWCVAGWCAPVHSTPGARPCTRHLVRARALDTWCALVHSTPGARHTLDTSPAHWRCGHPSLIT